MKFNNIIISVGFFAAIITIINPIISHIKTMSWFIQLKNTAMDQTLIISILILIILLLVVAIIAAVLIISYKVNKKKAKNGK